MIPAGSSPRDIAKKLNDKLDNSLKQYLIYARMV